METLTPTTQHGHTMRMDIHEIVRELNASLGPTLVAALAGSKDRKLPIRWAKDDGPKPRTDAERRLRFAHREWALLAAADGEHVARQWFIGGNLSRRQDRVSTSLSCHEKGGCEVARSTAVSSVSPGPRSSVKRMVQPTGRAGRAARLGMATFIYVGGSLLVLAARLGGADIPLPVGVGAGGVILMFAWLWCRFAQVGVYTSDDAILVTSWWRSRQFPESSILRVEAKPYTGRLYVFVWPVVSGSLQSGTLTIAFRDGTELVVKGSVTSLGASRRMAENLNLWLGLDVGMRRGERRQRRSGGREHDR